jgi:hypothetical protein
LEINPIDYIHQAIGVIIERLPISSDEYSLIEKYVKNTSGSSIDFKTHKLSVYRIQRKGEAEDI